MRREKNKGLTLVELLVSIAVLSIVTLGIGGLLRLAAEQYSNATKETEVQNMLQSTVASLSNQLADAALGVHFDNTKKQLTIVNKDNYVKFELNGTVLYYDEKTYVAASSDEDKNNEARAASVGKNQENVLADHVQSFYVDTSTSDKGLVVLTVDIRYYERSKKLVQNVFLRNRGGEKSTFVATNVGGGPSDPNPGPGPGPGPNPPTAAPTSAVTPTNKPVTPTPEHIGPVLTQAPTDTPTPAPTNTPTPTPKAETPGVPTTTLPGAPLTYKEWNVNNGAWDGSKNCIGVGFKLNKPSESVSEVYIRFNKPVLKTTDAGSAAGGKISLFDDYTIKVTYQYGMSYDDVFWNLYFDESPQIVELSFK